MPLLEVIALDAADAKAAAAGGADRLELVADMAADGLTPAVDTVARVREACDLQLRVMLRLRGDFTTADLAELPERAAALAAAGADGFVLGFLRDDRTMDLSAMRDLAAAVRLPWTCHRAVDHTADHAAAVAEVAALPGLDQILTAGHPDGVEAGLASLKATAPLGPLMAGGGLRPSQVPELRAAGITAFHIGSAARDDWAAPVSAQRVAHWRRLLDDSR